MNPTAASFVQIIFFIDYFDLKKKTLPFQQDVSILEFPFTSRWSEVLFFFLADGFLARMLIALEFLRAFLYYVL